MKIRPLEIEKVLGGNVTEETGFQISDEVQQKLDQLLTRLSTSEVVQAYKKIENQIADHVGLVEMTDEIKAYQKQAVKFAHYGKPEAEKQAIKQADRLTKAFDGHPLVVDYREKLIEANDLLQHVTKLLEKTVNVKLELAYEDSFIMITPATKDEIKDV